MRDPLNLATIHGQRRPAPRHYGSINRAIVVLTVAAWQAYVEALAMQILDEVSIPVGQPGHQLHLAMRADVTNARYRFSTPNAEGVRDLLLRVGFDPWPHWTWKWSRSLVTPELAHDQMNAWLRVRHAIAHGEAEVPREDALRPTRREQFVMNLPNANRCMKFFSWVADQTTAAAIAEFESPERATAWRRENPRYVDPKAARRRLLPQQRRTCPNCRKQFVPRYGAQLYCSDPCRQTARRARERRRLLLPKQRRTCPICQRQFVPRYGVQLYCSDPCRQTGRREKQRRAWERRRAAQHET